jgi:mycofactocin precursor
MNDENKPAVSTVDSDVPQVLEEITIEELNIDGICGIY